jgi:hypothetical protein
MSLFTLAQTQQLIDNCQAQIQRMDNAQPDIDFIPVVKLFTPDAQCTWLLTELGLDDIAFGLADLGMGTPELGFISMREIRELRGPLGLPVERNLHFDAYKTLSAYADEAREHGRIVTNGDFGRLASGPPDFLALAKSSVR